MRLASPTASLVAVVLSAATSARAQIDLPGTQPGELTQALRPPRVCQDCHGGYAPYAANDVWKGSMMANAARDPLFLAALTIANQDVPGAGDLCIRCHSPVGWLSGRSEPTDGSALLPDDLESVQCDFCHRLTSGPDGEHLIGTGQYFVADDFVRRGPIADAMAPHDTEHSPYFSESELCGLCHDVSNPLEGGFAIERTYTEWRSSAFASEGATCQSCHLPETDGFACGARDAPDRTVHAHMFAGGNAWMPLVLAGEHPELDREDAYRRTSDEALRMLRSAAELELRAAARAIAGRPLALEVRVTNLTGHKLPTGYPEGRRSWLEVRVVDPNGATVMHSGAYDAATATRAEDPQLRTYEVRMAANGEEGFHFILQNELLEDNRIPPRGFTPREDTRPVGREYAVQPDGTLAHWDDAPYVVHLARDATPGRYTIEATLWYQTTSRDYVEALRDENVTDDRGEQMYAIWERYDRAPPVAMATARAEIEIAAAPVPRGGGCAVLDQSPASDSASEQLFLAIALPIVARLTVSGRKKWRRRQSGH